MKKLYYLIILTVILGLVLTGCSLLSNISQVPATEQSGISYLTKNSNGELYTEAKPFIVDLLAGQDDPGDVGEIQVWNDTENLYITYKIDKTDWYLTETHLHVACGDNPIPVNRKGNPIPGHFDYGSEENVTVKEFTISLEDINCCDLDIAAHAVVEQLTDGGCADSVYDYDQGTQKGGGDIGSGRDVLENALGSIDKSFFSLGFVDEESGGWIIVEFADYVGTYLNVVEQSPGIEYGYPLEQAKVYVSADSEGPWTDLGMADNQIAGGPEKGQSHENVFDLEECIKFVKIIDQTNQTPHSGNADAFDLDAVCGGPCYQEETAWGEGGRFVDQGNWATYFNYTIQDVLVDTVEVDPSGTDPYIYDPTNSIDLQPSDYCLIASGIYRFAGWGEYGIADALCNRRTLKYASGTDVGEGWYILDNNRLQVFVFGSAVSWLSETFGTRTLDPYNIYSYEFTHTGGIIEFGIEDNAYSDNSGDITIEIWWKCS